MHDENKTREQLLNELTELRKRLIELEELETECRRAEVAAQAAFRYVEDII